VSVAFLFENGHFVPIKGHPYGMAGASLVHDNVLVRIDKIDHCLFGKF
jgi:hypothetical protein